MERVRESETASAETKENSAQQRGASVLLSLLLLSVAFVAFPNGANANFKGVASLYGSHNGPLSNKLSGGEPPRP